MNISEKISKEMEHDTEKWVSPESVDIVDLCTRYAPAVLETYRDNWRYGFVDGSAITGNADGWDIEGSSPFVPLGDDPLS